MIPDFETGCLNKHMLITKKKEPSNKLIIIINPPPSLSLEPLKVLGEGQKLKETTRDRKFGGE